MQQLVNIHILGVLVYFSFSVCFVNVNEIPPPPIALLHVTSTSLTVRGISVSMAIVIEGN